MSLKVLILGSGSALPTISSHQSAQIIECSNQLFLVDCGEGTQIELRRNKVKIQKIDHIFISHLHGDHFFGLVGLLSTMHLLGRKKELHVFGPNGLSEIVLLQFRNSGSHLSFELHFHEVKESGQVLFDNDQIEITSIPLKHRVPCFGFLFKEKIGLRKLKISALGQYKIPTYARKSIAEGQDFITEDREVIDNKLITDDPECPTSYAYCSDTAFSEKLLPIIKGVDLLYHETTFLESERERAKKTYHSTASDAAKIASSAGVKKLLIGHFSNRYKKYDAFLQEARPIFKETYIATEGDYFEAKLAK